MPIYKIRCTECGLTRELYFKTYAWNQEIRQCECGSKALVKVPSVSNFILDGPNWSSKKGM